MYNSSRMSISHPSAVIAIQNFLSYLLSLGPIFIPSHRPLPQGDFFPKSNVFLSGSEGRLSTKIEVDQFNSFWDILLTHEYRHKLSNRPCPGCNTGAGFNNNILYNCSLPTATHDVSLVFKSLDLITGKSNLTTTWDTLAVSDVCCHGSTFSWQQGLTKTEGKILALGLNQNWR